MTITKSSSDVLPPICGRVDGFVIPAKAGIQEE